MEHPYHRTTAADLRRMLSSELIRWLQWNDPNGCYDPDEVMAEFGAVNTREELLTMALEQIDA